eukprot:6161924-Pyramimonas_sp.AAC.1
MCIRDRLCSCPTARIKYKIPTTRIKMLEIADPAWTLFDSESYQIEMRSRRRAAIRSNITGKKKLEL